MAEISLSSVNDGNDHDQVRILELCNLKKILQGKKVGNSHGLQILNLTFPSAVISLKQLRFQYFKINLNVFATLSMAYKETFLCVGICMVCIREGT